ncbi:MAG: amidase family protein, partial [Burkholderiaceae bacterium]
THNPWDLSKTPGGSSGGAAVALATGMTSAEVGSDIGSSIRNPAHFNGIFGLKPSWGIISLRGHGAPGNYVPADIGVNGPLARSARDLDLLLDVLISPDPLDAPAWQVVLPRCKKKSVKEFKIALKLNDKYAPIDDQYAACLQNFADSLAAAGATVVEAEPDVDTSRVHEIYLRFLRAAMSAGMNEADIQEWRDKRDSPDGQRNPHYMQAVVEGFDMRHRDWLVLDNERRKLREKYATFFEDYDILLCPAAMSAAWPQNQTGERWQRQIPINDGLAFDFDQLFWSGYSGVVLLPSTVGPCGFVGQLPVGYQAIAGFGQDKTATAFSRAVERELVKFRPPPGYE